MKFDARYEAEARTVRIGISDAPFPCFTYHREGAPHVWVSGSELRFRVKKAAYENPWDLVLYIVV